jgi:hypothetical protein
MRRQTRDGAQKDVITLRGVPQLPHKMEKAAMREESEERPGGNLVAPCHGKMTMGVPRMDKLAVDRGWRHGESSYSRCRRGMRKRSGGAEPD